MACSCIVEFNKEKLKLENVESYKSLLGRLKENVLDNPGKILVWYRNENGVQELLTEKLFLDIKSSHNPIKLKAATGHFPTPFQILYLTNYFDKYKSTIKGKTREVFRKLIRLRYLDMNKLEVNEELIKAEDMTHLVFALPVMQFLQNLEVRGGKIESNAAIKFFPKIQALSHLKKLEISEIKLDIEAVRHLSQGIQELKELKEFGLIETKIEVQGMKNLAASLSQLENLDKINFRANELSIEGAKYLSYALVCMDKLKILNLSQNNIEAAGLNYVSKALARIQLTELYVKSNKLGVEGGRILGNLIRDQREIKEIDVSFNGLQDAGMGMVLYGAYTSKNVKKIHVSNNGTTQRTQHLLNLGIIHKNWEISGFISNSCKKCNKNCMDSAMCS